MCDCGSEPAQNNMLGVMISLSVHSMSVAAQRTNRTLSFIMTAGTQEILGLAGGFGPNYLQLSFLPVRVSD